MKARQMCSVARFIIEMSCGDDAVARLARLMRNFDLSVSDDIPFRSQIQLSKIQPMSNIPSAPKLRLHHQNQIE